MAKLVLLLVFVCFQFSSQEELGKPENEIVKPEIPTNNTELLDGADKKQWQPGKFDEDWTEEDEKWYQEIQGLLKGSDEDYDDDDDDDDDLDSKEFDKLMEELDKYFEGDSFEDSDEWYKGDDDWDIDLNHYPDYFENQKQGNSKNTYWDLYNFWYNKLQMSKAKVRKQFRKRFTSV